MRDLELYTTVLGIKSPWQLVDSQLDAAEQIVEVFVVHDGPSSCPVCGEPASKYDTRTRRWRHLDFCQYRLFISAEVPRVNCQAHGVKQIVVPWAEERSGFTALFEQCVIAWLRELSFEAVVRRMRISWDEIDGIMMRAVTRGLERRKKRVVRFIGIDEKSFRKRHKYFTIVSDLESQEVLWIGRGRKRETIDAFWRTLTPEQLAGIEGIAMDMWAPYFDSVVANVPDGKSKIVFDKYHIATYLSEALDHTRKRMSPDPAIDRTALKGRRWLLLRSPRKHEPLSEARVPQPARGIRRAGSRMVAGAGLQGALGVSLGDLGAQALQAVVLLGHALAAAALYQACQDAQNSSGETRVLNGEWSGTLERWNPGMEAGGWRL